MINYFLKKEKFLVTIFLVIFGLFIVRAPIHSEVVFTVDDPTGDVSDNGLCSITEALINSSSGDQSGSVDCPAGDFIKTVINLETDVVLSDEWPSIPGYGYMLSGTSADLVLNGNGHTISRDPLSANLGIFRSVGNYSYEFYDVTFSGGLLSSADPDINKGGAIFISTASSVLFDNVNFEDNQAADGGAVFIRKDSAPETNVEIIDSSFVNNFTTNNAGALYGVDVSISIENSTFEGNYSSGGGYGGNIYLDDSDLTINGSYFGYDGLGTGTINGGAIYADSSSSNILEINNSTFDSMYASSTGSAISLNNNISFDLINSVIYGGAGPSTPAISFIGQNNTINLSHNTFSSNNPNSGTSDIESSGIQTSAVIENNIFSNGNADICSGDFTNFTFTNNLSDTEDLDCSLTSDVLNIDSTPTVNGILKFIAINSGSPTIGSAVAGANGCPSEDIRGYPRPFGDFCDVGSYEYTGEPAYFLTETDSNTTVSESGLTDTYSIYLGKSPSSYVLVNISSADSSLNISPSSLNFGISNWYTPQTITLSYDDNQEDEGDRSVTITHSVTTSDVNYSAISPSDLNVNVIDDDESQSSSGSSGSSPSNPVNPVNLPQTPQDVPVPGCVNPLALNFNPSANQSDGSCAFPVPEMGCMDSNAINYNQNATLNFGCIYENILEGCTNSSAINYISNATIDDGSCVFESVTELEEPENESEDDVLIDGDIKTAIENENSINKKETIPDILGDFSELIKTNSKETIALAGAGLVAPFIAVIVSSPGTIVTFPLQIWNLTPTLLGIRRRRRPWGTVYDSVTKQPLDPVHVSLTDSSGQVVSTAITDMDGRFGFLASPGFYTISFSKTNYTFPSEKLKNKKDDFYENLYFGETIEIKEEDSLVVRNIPMDSVGFNWNEFNKSQNRELMKFYSSFEIFLSKFAKVLFYIGFIVSVIVLILNPVKISLIILLIYLLILGFKILGVRVKKPGYVLDKNGYPISFGIIKLFSKNLNREISSSVIGKTGKYYILTPSGEFYIKVYTKLGENEYAESYVSDSINIKKGYLDKKILI